MHSHGGEGVAKGLKKKGTTKTQMPMARENILRHPQR